MFTNYSALLKFSVCIWFRHVVSMNSHQKINPHMWLYKICSHKHLELMHTWGKHACLLVSVEDHTQSEWEPGGLGNLLWYHASVKCHRNRYTDGEDREIAECWSSWRWETKKHSRWGRIRQGHAHEPDEASQPSAKNAIFHQLQPRLLTSDTSLGSFFISVLYWMFCVPLSQKLMWRKSVFHSCQQKYLNCKHIQTHNTLNNGFLTAR